jgi:Kef-type K+ transport system membrane component KefB
VGLIIAGVIIGPYGFNIIESSSSIDLFSTIGLLYIMFIAGLELDLNEFKSNRNKSLLFGIFTFTFPLAIGYPVCHYLLGYDTNASLLISSMFATHTLVSYPIVSKLGVSKNQAVAITVGGTILTDTAVLTLLSVKVRVASTLSFGLDWVFLLRFFWQSCFSSFQELQNGFFKNWRVKNIRTTSLFCPLCFLRHS